MSWSPRPTPAFLCGALAAAALLLAPAASADSWVEVAVESPDDPRVGYRVFERTVPGSIYKAYRIEAMLPTTPERARDAARLRVLDPRYKGTAKERSVLRNDGDGLLLYYRIGAPMIDDRDGVNRFEPLDDGEWSGWSWRTVQAGPKPIEGVVRMPSSSGSWRFKRGANGHTHAIYESHSDLGGSIPGWLINRMMVGEQLKELQLLRNVLSTHDTPKLRDALARLDRPTPAPVGSR